MGLRPKGHRIDPAHARPRLRLSPSRVDQGSEGRGGPGVHHIRIRRKVSASARAGGYRMGDRRVDGKLSAFGYDRRAAGPAVPDREGNAVITLSGDAPVPSKVFDPVVVSDLHRGRMPGDLRARVQKRRLHVEHPDEPLGCGPIFDLRAAALMDVDHMRDLRSAQEQTGCVQIPNDRGPGLREGSSRVRSGLLGHRTLLREDGARRQLVLLPPRHIRRIPKGAAHHDTGPLFRVRSPVREHGHLPIEQRRPGPTADQVSVPRVLRMHKESDTRGQQFRPGRGDSELFASCLEKHRMKRAPHLPVLHLGLRHRGAALRAPERRVHLPVRAPGLV